MKKLVLRKVTIVKEVPTVDVSWLFPKPHGKSAKKGKAKKQPKKTLAQKIAAQEDDKRRAKWRVKDNATGDTIGSFDSPVQAKRFCIKNDYDFGLYA